ncbi:hypothetical protein PSN01_02507 [Micromonospora saelicesensis]|nr:hypothetical protein PSN01_02507 [Micromonospora saelicesensis]
MAARSTWVATKSSRASSVNPPTVLAVDSSAGAAQRASAACRSANSALLTPAYAASRISGVANE